jgi:hypothetical protein
VLLHVCVFGFCLFVCLFFNLSAYMCVCVVLCVCEHSVCVCKLSFALLASEFEKERGE